LSPGALWFWFLFAVVPSAMDSFKKYPTKLVEP